MLEQARWQRGRAQQVTVVALEFAIIQFLLFVIIIVIIIVIAPLFYFTRNISFHPLNSLQSGQSP